MTVIPTTAAPRSAPPRHEALSKVLGAARYTADEPHEGLAHAALVLADEACGELVAIDTNAARQVPGVLGIYTHENLPPLKDAGVLRLCAGTRIHHRGQPVAIVIAETLTAARIAAAKVVVDIIPQPARALLGDSSEGLFAPPTAGRVPTDTARGDADAALARADVIVDSRFDTAANVHLAMEPHVSTVIWGKAAADGSDGPLTLHLFTSTQAVHGTRRVMAHMLGLPAANVRVTCRLIGGGFGAKGQLWWSHTALLAQAARDLGRPVRLELTRTDTFHQVGRRSPSRQRVRLGARHDGVLTAIIHEAAHETSPYGEYCDSTASTSRWLYGCADVRTAHRLARINAPQPIPMRAPGTGPGQFALESAIDQLAHKLNLDPLELRLRNLPERDLDQNLPWSSFSLRQCLRVGAESFGWVSRAGGDGQGGGDGGKKVDRQTRDGRWRIGCGMASAVYHVYRQPSQVEVLCLALDHYVVRCGTQDMGSGTFTAIARIAADELGCDPAAIRVEIGDTQLPEGPYSGGSMVTGSVAPAVAAAARELRERLQAGEHPSPDAPLIAHARAEPDAKPTTNTYATGAVFVRVRVDTLTGEVRVSHITAAYAAGRIVDPVMVRSQYIGGLIGGIGMALHEVSVTDPNQARIVNDDLCGYLVPTHADMPEFDIHLVDEHDSVIGEGVKGVGMLGTCGTAAAIANAVFDATGVRVPSLPIRLEHLLETRDPTHPGEFD